MTNEVYYYIDQTDELLSLDELTIEELEEVTKMISDEVARRIYDSLPEFYGDARASIIPPEVQVLFQTWAGVVPRRIGVWV